MYQEITLIGNLGREAELRYIPSGSAVCDFSLAVNREYKNSAGEQIKETAWFRVSVWGKYAEAINPYLTKGKQVLVVGRLRPDKDSGGPRVYQKQDGTWAASFEVTANEIKLLGKKNGESGGGDEGPESRTDEEEIPF
jgi:single-strand DNA-binding protein